MEKMIPAKSLSTPDTNIDAVIKEFNKEVSKASSSGCTSMYLYCGGMNRYQLKKFYDKLTENGYYREISVTRIDQIFIAWGD